MLREVNTNSQTWNEFIKTQKRLMHEEQCAPVMYSYHHGTATHPSGIVDNVHIFCNADGEHEITYEMNKTDTTQNKWQKKCNKLKKNKKYKGDQKELSFTIWQSPKKL